MKAPYLFATSLFLCSLPTIGMGFCGFYVSGGGAKLFNNATQVVLMREGTKTVLSMQNNYQGPPKDFALVIPVPVVLQKENVRTLPREAFEQLDQLDAPRLVEYWEQDPCHPYEESNDTVSMIIQPKHRALFSMNLENDLGVIVEAQFTVGEYEIVILSAKESTGLETWLHQNNYKIPKGAEEVLRPYVEQGMKFFVAKVDTKKVSFSERKQAMLSPLRFSFDAESFSLPMRLGLLNSSGEQDLIIHILARDRYEAANYPNVTIPTNLEVKEATKEEFGSFYASLFDETLRRNPDAVVTEYAWSAANCDPCPGSPLSVEDFLTLGADTLTTEEDPEEKAYTAAMYQRRFVLTRLHTRYSASSLGDDIIFQKADHIFGGREVFTEDNQLESGATSKSYRSSFQGRYVIRHPWEGLINCESPQRGVWGNRPGLFEEKVSPKTAQGIAFVKRGVSYSSYLVSPEIELKSYKTPASLPQSGDKPVVVPKVRHKGFGCAISPERSAAGFFFGLFALLAFCRLLKRPK